MTWPRGAATLAVGAAAINPIITLNSRTRLPTTRRKIFLCLNTVLFISRAPLSFCEYEHSLDYLHAETSIDEKPVFYLSYPYCSPFQISRHATPATIK